MGAVAGAEVKLDDAGKAVADAIAKVDLEHAKFGETLTIDSIAAQPSSTIETEKLRASLGALKLKIIDDRTYGNTIMITVQAANGARARIDIEQGGGTILLMFVVRGACGHDLGVIGPGSFAFDAGTTAIDASGFRPFVMSAEQTQLGKDGTPEMKTTIRRFAVKRGKYAQADRKVSTGVWHHCSTWHCTSP